jgi:hypothetical protein
MADYGMYLSYGEDLNDGKFNELDALNCETNDTLTIQFEAFSGDNYHTVTYQVILRVDNSNKLYLKFIVANADNSSVGLKQASGTVTLQDKSFSYNVSAKDTANGDFRLELISETEITSYNRVYLDPDTQEP